MKVQVVLINGEVVVSELDARTIQEVIDIVFSGEFFVDEAAKTVIIPREKILKVVF